MCVISPYHHYSMNHVIFSGLFFFFERGVRKYEVWCKGFASPRQDLDASHLWTALHDGKTLGRASVANSDSPTSTSFAMVRLG